MNAIVVVDKNWAIGKDNNLLVHLPGDLKYFREKTLGKTIVMGRKTLESFPGGKPLPKRNNIVLTGNEEFCSKECKVCYSFEQLLKELPDEEIFIAGGESVYKQFMSYINTIYVTKIEEEFQADTYFENLDESNEFSLVWQDSIKEEGGIKYYFTRYERNK